MSAMSPKVHKTSMSSDVFKQSGQIKPVICFYSIEQMVTVRRLERADFFVGQYKSQIYYLKNLFWNEKPAGHFNPSQIMESKQFILEAVDLEFDNENYQDDAESADNSYQLVFAENKSFDIVKKTTIQSKKVTTHLHNMGQYFTIVFNGLASFTFELEENQPLTSEQQWNGQFGDLTAEFEIKMKKIQNENKLWILGLGEIEDEKAKFSSELTLGNRESWTYEG